MDGVFGEVKLGVKKLMVRPCTLVEVSERVMIVTGEVVDGVLGEADDCGELLASVALRRLSVLAGVGGRSVTIRSVTDWRGVTLADDPYASSKMLGKVIVLRGVSTIWGRMSPSDARRRGISRRAPARAEVVADQRAFGALRGASPLERFTGGVRMPTMPPVTLSPKPESRELLFVASLYGLPWLEGRDENDKLTSRSRNAASNALVKELLSRRPNSNWAASFSLLECLPCAP